MVQWFFLGKTGNSEKGEEKQEVLFHNSVLGIPKIKKPITAARFYPPIFTIGERWLKAGEVPMEQIVPYNNKMYIFSP